VRGLTAVFANFKLDSFYEQFVPRYGNRVVPDSEPEFVRWWLDLNPELSPRLANYFARKSKPETRS